MAHGINELAIIRGPRIPGLGYEDLSRIPHSYLNERQLRPRTVSKILSASRVGLALSAAEGACLASSEYLLCGLPVVSTPSRGGRDIWYDQNNSVICEPTEASVGAAVRHAIAELDAGRMDAHSIRRRHIEQAREHRLRFLDVTRHAFAQVGVTASPEVVFNATLINGLLPPYLSYKDVERLLGEE